MSKAVVASPRCTGAKTDKARSSMFFPFERASIEDTFSSQSRNKSAHQIPMLRFIGFLVLFPAIAIAAGAADRPSGGDIPRFGILTDGLYRGGQPISKGFQFLKDKGIKTIINLRKEDNSEAKVVEKLGMNYVQIPIDEVMPW